MISGNYGPKEVTKLCGRVTIDDNDEEEGFVCDEVDIKDEGNTNHFLLLAKVISDRPFNMKAFRDTMAGVWRPVK